MRAPLDRRHRRRGGSSAARSARGHGRTRTCGAHVRARTAAPASSDDVVGDLAHASDTRARAMRCAGVATRRASRRTRARDAARRGAQFDARLPRGQRRRDDAARAGRGRGRRAALRVREHGQGERRGDAAGPAVSPRRRARAAGRLRAQQARPPRRALRRRRAAGTPMDVVVLRLPLVYGPGARGNFRALVDAVRAAAALPFGAIDNRRSVARRRQPASTRSTPSIDAPAASRRALRRRCARACRRRISCARSPLRLDVEPRLVAVPVPLLRLAGALCGRRDAIARLTGSLEVDTSSLIAATGWRPRRIRSIELAR